MSPHRAEPVAVIGAGIVGSLIALNLARGGADTILIDAQEKVGGASSLSFAAITALEKEPWDYYRLNCHGIAGWRRLGPEIGEDIGLRWGGDFRWTADRDAGEKLWSIVRRAKSHGYPVRMMGPTELERRLPDARTEGAVAASFAPQDGHVEPHLATDAFRRAAEGAGARLMLGRPARLRFRTGGVEVEVGDDVFHPRQVVLSAGAESVEVAAQAGVDIPTVASSGLIVHAGRVPPLSAGTVHIPSPPGTKTYLRHRIDGSVLIGEESERGIAVSPTREHAEVVLGRAARSFPALRATRVIDFSVVWRSMPADHLPIIGPLPGVEAVYVAVMHSGFTLAPAIGELAAREIIEGVELETLAGFRPSRFSERVAATMLEIESVFSRPQ